MDDTRELIESLKREIATLSGSTVPGTCLQCGYNPARLAGTFIQLLPSPFGGAGGSHMF